MAIYKNYPQEGIADLPTNDIPSTGTTEEIVFNCDKSTVSGKLTITKPSMKKQVQTPNPSDVSSVSGELEYTEVTPTIVRTIPEIVFNPQVQA